MQTTLAGAMWIDLPQDRQLSKTKIVQVAYTLLALAPLEDFRQPIVNAKEQRICVWRQLEC